MSVAATEVRERAGLRRPGAAYRGGRPERRLPDPAAGGPGLRGGPAARGTARCDLGARAPLPRGPRRRVPGGRGAAQRPADAHGAAGRGSLR